MESTLKAVDLNADDLTYELVNAPQGMAIALNGTISWRPGDEQIGSHTVIIRVSDPSGEIDLQNFTVKVKPGNRKPVMMSPSIETKIQRSINLFTGAEYYAGLFKSGRCVDRCKYGAD
jgi:hypothetical protein